MQKEEKEGRAVTGCWVALFGQLPNIEPLERGSSHNCAIVRGLAWGRNKWSTEIMKMEINGLQLQFLNEQSAALFCDILSVTP